MREFTFYHNDYVIWANQKTESFVYHWLRALAMFDEMSFPAIGRHFKFCRYVNLGSIVIDNTCIAVGWIRRQQTHDSS